MYWAGVPARHHARVFPRDLFSSIDGAPREN
jgi:hypothetical protein